MPHCNECHTTKNHKSFTIAFKIAPDKFSDKCNACIKETLKTEFKCVRCDKVKTHFRFTNEMVLELEPPVCHGCTNKENGIRPGHKKKCTIINTCLRCDRKFMAESKFNRICDNCKGSENYKQYEQWE